MPSDNDLFDIAMRHWHSGQPQQAEYYARQALALNPRHGGALQLMGTLAYQGGRADRAVDWLRQAVAAGPTTASYHTCLGAAYQDLGRLDDALACHQEALRLLPGNAQVLNNLAIALAARGDREGARAAFEQALRHNADDPEVLCNLAIVLNQLGRAGEAIAHYQQALRLRPDFAQAHNNLGNALLDQGKLDEAIASYQRAIVAAPQFAQAHNNLGRVLQSAGQLDRAIECYRRLLHGRPDYVDAHINLSGALLARHHVAEALASAREALRLRPNDADAWNNLGNAQNTQGDLDDAVASYQRALRLRPDLTPARFNLGLAVQARGQLAEALELFREVLRVKPEDRAAHSTYLTSLNYDPHVTPDVLLAEHRRWAELHAPPAAPSPHTNTPDPKRRLRVGYVSADFRSHAVSYFLEPILRHHDREQVECVCYADVAAPDAATAHLRALADQWHDTLGLSDEQLARRLRADGIDVLVDLAGHTPNHRLRAFALRPAPVQVTYLGYPCTTGLDAIGYRLADAVTEPPGAAPCGSEEVVRLAPVFCCYAPPPDAPDVSPSPASRRGTVTFGSLHKLEKLNDGVLDLWCRILADVPSARLLLSRNTLKGQAAEMLRRRFAERGVGPERLALHHAEPVNRQHLRVYEEIDVSLDAFPWSGHTTACESLWLGVPVVTLRGRHHAGRMVAGILSCVGLGELIGDTPEDYHAAAVRLAGDVAGLAELRAGLRERVRQAPLCDGAGFTRGLERAYREMWRPWCERASAGAK